MLLLPEGAAFCQPRLSAGGLTENGGASDAQDDSLGVAENCGDLVTSRALDVHEEGVGVLDQTLQLALALFLLGEGVQQILCELKTQSKVIDQFYENSSWLFFGFF